MRKNTVRINVNCLLAAKQTELSWYYPMKGNISCIFMCVAFNLAAHALLGIQYHLWILSLFHVKTVHKMEQKYKARDGSLLCLCMLVTKRNKINGSGVGKMAVWYCLDASYNAATVGKLLLCTIARAPLHPYVAPIVKLRHTCNLPWAHGSGGGHSVEGVHGGMSVCEHAMLATAPWNLEELVRYRKTADDAIDIRLLRN